MILTLGADDLGLVPLAVGATLGRGDVALQEAVGALVAHHRVDVVVRPLAPNQEGVLRRGRSPTKHCPRRGRETEEERERET